MTYDNGRKSLDFSCIERERLGESAYLLLSHPLGVYSPPPAPPPSLYLCDNNPWGSWQTATWVNFSRAITGSKPNRRHRSVLWGHWKSGSTCDPSSVSITRRLIFSAIPVAVKIPTVDENSVIMGKLVWWKLWGVESFNRLQFPSFRGKVRFRCYFLDYNGSSGEGSKGIDAIRSLPDIIGIYSFPWRKLPELNRQRWKSSWLSRRRNEREALGSLDVCGTLRWARILENSIIEVSENNQSRLRPLWLNFVSGLIRISKFHFSKYRDTFVYLKSLS